MNFLDDLNESQRKAVEYCDGPSLVIAGAGSGKTRVLTYKIAYLLSQGMKPWNILALTFTNKAANEMKQRIGALVGNDMARSLNMGTFHSVFSRILRVEAASLGYSPNYTIYDESDSRSLIKTIIKEMQLDDKLYKPASISSRISMAKNHLVLPQDYAINRNLLERDREQRVPAMCGIRNAEGERLELKEAYSDREEALIVCNEIKRIRREDDCEYGDFAVLYRTNSQSRSFEEAMRKAAIPYKIYGGLSFYQRKEIKDVIAYFRMVVNPDDEEAFKRIVNYPKRGIGDTTVAKIAGLASVAGVSLWAVICEPARYGLSVSKGTMAKIDSFRELILYFAGKLVSTDAYELGLELVKASGISADIYADRTPENLSRQENVEELLGSMQEFVESHKEEGLENEIGLVDFLKEVSLQTDIESEAADDDESRVSLMTVHSAKGLEFPTVFVVGLEENIFPSLMSLNSRREIEEERRLLYVAITRAERHCILTYAKTRYRYGRMESEAPSRFLRDISPELITVDGSSGGMSHFDGRRSFMSFQAGDRWQNSRPVASQFKADPKPREASHREEPPVADTFSPGFQRLRAVASLKSRRVQPAAESQSAAVGGLKEGCVIEHERFGMGKVTRLEGSGENLKATVQFENAGVKQLLVKFARFKVVG